MPLFNQMLYNEKWSVWDTWNSFGRNVRTYVTTASHRLSRTITGQNRRANAVTASHRLSRTITGQNRRANAVTAQNRRTNVITGV